MLEIPESHTISKQLNQTIKGKTIQNVYANSSPHSFAFFFGDPNHYHSLLTRKILGNAAAIAGQVEITAENSRLLFSDGVNIRYFNPGEILPKKHQLHIEFQDSSSIVCTVQMYGGLWVFSQGENDNLYYLVAKQKPSPLSEEFHENYFETLLSGVKQSLSVKAFLATEQRIPGLGNGVLQDILFNAKINPKSRLEALSQEEVESLFKNIKNTLFEMIDKGGRDTEKDLFGSRGGYKTILSNKTFKNPCPICGDTIIRQAYLGGNVYYCPTCQPIRK
ncbi:formamidopyrimidine-DNA glycosylase [Clostridium amylolyticum]|uniref:Formamidopyrimidine-DNA glycosylase n=1 Tax=Clostridium amylolyticum TaxID=1121298 RepID=A0A1M6ELA2_9CLOT|nr:endonuclease VIII [Clostridium amylolyticum]SHI86292.1 formamidopyrimidine-DNA glycosylase [Clostridium amylolyticum]